MIKGWYYLNNLTIKKRSYRGFSKAVFFYLYSSFYTLTFGQLIYVTGDQYTSTRVSSQSTNARAAELARLIWFASISFTWSPVYIVILIKPGYKYKGRPLLNPLSYYFSMFEWSPKPVYGWGIHIHYNYVLGFYCREERVLTIDQYGQMFLDDCQLYNSWQITYRIFVTPSNTRAHMGLDTFTEFLPFSKKTYVQNDVDVQNVFQKANSLKLFCRTIL